MPTKEIKGDIQLTTADGQVIGYVDSVTIEVEEEAGKSRAVETLEDAARYAYGVAETRKEIAKLQATAAKEIAHWQEKIAEVESWCAEVVNPLQDKLNYLTMMLTMFHVNQFNEAPTEKAQAKLKSIKLPYGITLSSREMPVALEVTDNEALLTYAKAIGQTDTPEPKAKWGEIKKGLSVNEGGLVADLNGEILPFIKATPQDRKFEVK